MKTKIKYLFFLFFFVITPINQIICQDQSFLSFQENINLPKDNLGVMPEYIVEVNDVVNEIPVHKLYVYGMQGILIYDLNNTNWSFPGKIEFTEESGQPFGFYDRSLFSNLLSKPAREPMIYVPADEGFGQLFAVGPDLRLWCINVRDDSPVHILSSSHLVGKSLISSKLVFDPINTRIMWLAYAKADNIEDPLCYLLPVSLNGYFVGNPLNPSGYISDFAINNAESVNIMYLGVPTSQTTGSWVLIRRDNFDPVQSYNLTFCPGLIKYIKTQDMHQVFCLPDCYNTQQAAIYIFNGDSPSHIPITILSPVPGYMCAGFNDARNHLFLGVYTGYDEPVFNDVYIFQCQNNSNPLLLCSLNTNGFASEKQNLPFTIVPVSENENLIMKRHEVVTLTYNQGSQCPYTYQSLLKAYGNYFGNAVTSSDAKVFITSMLAGGFIEYETSNTPWVRTDHQTGQSVHACFTNESSGKNYYFSKTPVANSHVFIDEDFTLGTFSDYSYENPIGDIIYNPFQHHILISDYIGIPNAHLNAYSETQGGLLLVSQIGINETHNGEMFITNDGKLLYFTGGNNVNPQIKVRSALNYNLSLGQINLTKTEFSSSDQLDVLFAGNPYQNYFVLSDVPHIESGQSNQPSSQISYFYVLNPANIAQSPCVQISHDTPKILEAMYITEPYESMSFYAYVGGSEPVISEIYVDYQTQAMTVYEISLINPLSSMKLVRYPVNEGFTEELYLVTWQEGTSSKLFKYLPGSHDYPEFITNINSAISSMSFNFQTGLLYCYGTDNLESTVYQFDVLNQLDNEFQALNLKRILGDNLGSSILVDGNEMLFDNEIHEVNIPNGDKSSISRLGFEFDRLHLKDKVSWFSFPRLERDENNPVPAIPVLEKIRPFPSTIYMENLPLQEDYPPLKTITYWNSSWDGSLTEIQSTYGYKHSTDNPFISYQPMLGNILDPSTSITIFPNHENWVGYFPTWPQDPFDALAPVLDKLTLIKHHDWACVKTSCPGMGPGQPEPTCWMCSITTPLKYGDMVILECSENATFQWGEEFSSQKRELLVPVYFEYSETADYTPIFIELDSNDQPVEVGAFIGNKCIGASTVESVDSDIMIRSYIPSDTSGVITFESYYGFEKALPEKVNEYFVRNQETGIREKRVINSRERKKFYQVSFKNESSSLLDLSPLKFNFYPNPGSGSGILDYFLPQESEVVFELFDMYGRKMNSLFVSKKEAGQYSTSRPNLILDNPGQGIFLIRMSACGNSVTTKIIISR